MLQPKFRQVSSALPVKHPSSVSVERFSNAGEKQEVELPVRIESDLQVFDFSAMTFRNAHERQRTRKKISRAIYSSETIESY